MSRFLDTLTHELSDFENNRLLYKVNEKDSIFIIDKQNKLSFLNQTESGKLNSKQNKMLFDNPF